MKKSKRYIKKQNNKPLINKKVLAKVNADNTDLLILSCNYSIQWKECSCLKGIRLEDVTAELEEEAYEEMRNNK